MPDLKWEGICFPCDYISESPNTHYTIWKSIGGCDMCDHSHEGWGLDIAPRGKSKITTFYPSKRLAVVAANAYAKAFDA